MGEDDRAAKPGARSAEPEAIRPAGAHPRYRQVSIQRLPRTAWERLAAWFGARYFEVHVEPIEDEASRPALDPIAPHERAKA